MITVRDERFLQTLAWGITTASADQMETSKSTDTFWGSSVKKKNILNQCCGSGSGIRDPGSGAFFTPRIRDPWSGSGMEQWSDPDPGSVIKHTGSATLFWTRVVDMYCFYGFGYEYSIFINPDPYPVLGKDPS
jgi:hypothetical protein